MDLLLTHGYFLYEDPKELQIMKPYVPLGILYIASHLRAKGVDVEVFDTTFSSRATLFDVLRSNPPRVLGVYSNLMTRPNVVEILRVAKEAGWKTVAGGPEPGAYVEEYLAAGADVVVIGEGEVTMEELLPALNAGPIGSADSEQALARVNGISFRAADGSVCRTAARLRLRISTRSPGRCARPLTSAATSAPGASITAWARSPSLRRAAVPTTAAGAATKSSARRIAAANPPRSSTSWRG